MLEKVREYINAHQNKQILGIVLILLILAILPVTVIISQQQQEIRQRAYELVSPPFPISTQAPVVSFGKAVKLDNGRYVSSYITVPVSGEYQHDLVCSFQTLEMWLKIYKTTFGKSGQIIRKVIPFTGFSLDLNGSGTLATIYRNRQFFSNTPLAPDKWHHVAVVVNYSTKKVNLYLNGKLDGSMILPDDDGYCRRSGDIYIGSSSGLGEVDEVRLHDKPLYSSEFNPPSSPFVPDSKTILLYHFDDYLTDSSPSKLHGRRKGDEELKFVDSTIGSPSVTPTPTPIPVCIPSAEVWDGKDNDCDGVIDESCLKPTSAAVAGTCTACSADFNRDGKTDSKDSKAIKACLKKPITGTCINGDINKDGRINIIDANCVLRNIGKQCVRSSP